MAAASDAVLDRLTALHPKLIDLSLVRTERLLAALGRPQDRLPPTIHVAGTNGKGSAIAFMRAIAEAAGLSVHAYTSPHLVRFHERIVLNGRAVSEEALLDILEECEAANGGAPVTFFEITTAAAFLAFARRPADLLLLETGLGGRLDSTNAISAPAVAVIAPVSVDHANFLGDTREKIAFEKAGILKPGAPCVVAPQPADALAAIEARAAEVAAPLLVAGREWSAEAAGAGMTFRDARAEFALPPPALRGPHQVTNAGVATAAMRCWRPDAFGQDVLAAGLAGAVWPARFQRLSRGRLPSLLPKGRELWIDGGHNPAAGAALAAAVAQLPAGRSLGVVCAMQAGKDAEGFIAPLADVAERFVAVDLPGESAGAPPERLAAIARRAGVASATAGSLEDALKQAAACDRLLVCGSLYLAGAALRENG